MFVQITGQQLINDFKENVANASVVLEEKLKALDQAQALLAQKQRDYEEYVAGVTLQLQGAEVSFNNASKVGGSSRPFAPQELQSSAQPMHVFSLTTTISSLPVAGV